MDIPVRIPPGHKITDITIVSTGFADIPQGGYAAISTKIISGKSIIGFSSKRFHSGYSSTYDLATKTKVPILNNCSSYKITNLKVNTNLIAFSMNPTIQTTINISTQDISAPNSVKFILKTTPC